MVFAQPEPLQDACGEDPSFLCQRVHESTGSELWAEASDKVLAMPATILMIVAIAYVASRLVRRAIKHLTDEIAQPESQDRLRNLKRRAPTSIVDTGSLSLRSGARAQTLGLVLRSIASAIIWAIATTMVLGELGVNLGPLIAGAGIAGVAIGFGAQSLVKDFLAGIFMLIEDQYGVGDIIDAGEAIGTVEAVTLRTTRLRDIEGAVWHIPNGTIQRVGNMSQQWARALLDVDVAYGTDVDFAKAVIKRVADDLWRDREWRWQVIEEPEIWGIERLGPDAISIRLVIKTRPGEQFPVMRELRGRLAEAFVEAGIEIPFPQRSVWVRRDPGSSQEVEADAFGDGGGGPADAGAPGGEEHPGRAAPGDGSPGDGPPPR